VLGKFNSARSVVSGHSVTISHVQSNISTEK